MVYLISGIYDMTPLRQLFVACITIIDTIILTNYTNDAYIFDTYDMTPLRQGRACLFFPAGMYHMYRRR
jgi:hypothetical protein